MKKITFISSAIIIIAIKSQWQRGYTEIAKIVSRDTYFGERYETKTADITLCNHSKSCGWKIISNSKLKLTGDIDEKNSSPKKLVEILENNKSVNELILNSPGGDALTGMQIGEIIRKRKLNTTVDGICVSSCANYIFPSGNIRKLQGILAFHGGVSSVLLEEQEDFIRSKTDKNIIPLSKETMSSLKSFASNEKEYLEKIGVSINLIMISGKLDKGAGHGIPIGMLIPTKAELEKYGISNIIGNQDEEILCGMRKRSELLKYSPEYKILYRGNLNCEKFEWF